MCFRGHVALEKQPAAATFRLFADSRYILYINGKQVARGPARSDPRWQFYDEVDAAAYLHAGENVIAALVLYYGYGTGHSMNTVPCFFLDGDADGLAIRSDASWVCEKLEAFMPEPPRVNGCKGPCEMFDNRKYNPRWMLPEFDDSGWTRVHTRDVNRMSPFRNLLARPIPMLTETEIPAVCVSAVGRGKQIRESDLAHLHLSIKEECRTMRLQAANDPLPRVFPGVWPGEASVLCVDFGKVYAGYLQFAIDGHDGDVVDVIFAEVKTPDLRPFFDGVSYRPISRFVLREGANDLRIFFNYDAMRYAYLIYRGVDATLRAASVSWVTYPLERMAEFSAADAKLTKLWDISVHTLRLCMQDGFLDSPSREQQQWMGDARCQSNFNAYVSGDMRILRKVLYQFAQSQDYEGMTCSRYPDENINLAPIPGFCLQWIGAFGDYYNFTADQKPVQDLYDHMIRAMRWFTAFEREDALVWNLPYWQYYDTGVNASGRHGDFFVGAEGCACAVDNLMLLEATAVMAKFGRMLADVEAAEFYEARHAALAEACRRAFWDAGKGCVIDCVRPTRRSESVSEIVNALALLHLYAPGSDEAEAILAHVFETEPEGLVHADLYSMSLVIRALVKHGRQAAALRLAMGRFSEMLSDEADATSTWETWRLFRKNADGSIAGQRSACHAWGASGVLIAAELLGGVRYQDGAPMLTEAPVLVDFDARFEMPVGWTLVCRCADGKLSRELTRS